MVRKRDGEKTVIPRLGGAQVLVVRRHLLFVTLRPPFPDRHRPLLFGPNKSRWLKMHALSLISTLDPQTTNTNTVVSVIELVWWSSTLVTFKLICLHSRSVKSKWLLFIFSKSNCKFLPVSSKSVCCSKTRHLYFCFSSIDVIFFLNLLKILQKSYWRYSIAHLLCHNSTPMLNTGQTWPSVWGQIATKHRRMHVFRIQFQLKMILKDYIKWHKILSLFKVRMCHKWPAISLNCSDRTFQLLYENGATVQINDIKDGAHISRLVKLTVVTLQR